MLLNDPLENVPGIGEVNAKRLAKLNLYNIEDLINHYPFRYDDFSKVTKIVDAKLDQNVTLRGEIWSIKNIYSRYGKKLTKAVLNDGSGPIEIIWFNSAWITKSIKPSDIIQVSGKITKLGSKLSIVAPDWEKYDPDKNLLHTGRLVPVYPETYGISSKWLRFKLSSLLPNILPKITDPLSDIKNEMVDLVTALSQIHFPQDLDKFSQARERLSFDELFYLSLATQFKRKSWQNSQLIKPLKIDSKQFSRFLKSLPFELTSAQKRVIDEITQDLKKDQPMNRLLQGEVGSGKTVVAATIIYINHQNGLKSYLMAPTEILAFQHFSTLTQLLSPFGIKVGIYTGSKKDALDKDVIVGTHALLSPKLESDSVGLIIIDEQQRFGVQQRSLLRSKSKLPHFLSMTATPIPRTVALTLYGDLDLSVIDEMPKGRKKVRTYVVPHYKRDDAYGFIAKKISEGDQAYVITPLIEESETLVTAKAAKVEYEKLKSIFPQFRLGLLHGKLKSKEKEEIINDFKDKKIDILVSTSVVEVGMDITNATIILIEGSERFGLSQLHQLRGRVGRGDKESFCLLFTETEEASILSRLKHLEKTHDGLTLAELDLKIRGGGDIFGIRQSGRWQLKIASFSDLSLIERTKAAAEKLLQDDPKLDKHPQIKGKLHGLSDIMPD